ncbi:Uncharacterized protein MCHI_003424 [Candidatus Magnetoovum chiemensis]|nr:Uncharacterized protein MCHI_003424 [Candidatus Magnetoovum chiemensis]
METILNKLKKSPVEEIQLSIDDSFTFRCHSEVSCFNKCCGDLEIFLTPYDILRMRKNRNITSTEFLLTYTETVILKDTQIPLIKLKMKENGRCSFNTETKDGCIIYNDRPVACRYYPIGMGAFKRGRLGGKEFFFLIKEDHCNGFQEKTESMKL